MAKSKKRKARRNVSRGVAHIKATFNNHIVTISDTNGDTLCFASAGTVGIDVAEIHGRFEGELTARKTLVIHATGKVSGKIRYGKLHIEEGGEVSGDVGSIAAGDSARKNVTAPKPLTGVGAA